MKISEQAVDHPRVVIVAALLITAMAVMAAINIPVQRTPAISTAVILVAVPFPGALPTETESQITREIETALQSLNDVTLALTSFADCFSRCKSKRKTNLFQSVPDCRIGNVKLSLNLLDVTAAIQKNCNELQLILAQMAKSTTRKFASQLSPAILAIQLRDHQFLFAYRTISNPVHSL